MVQFIFFGDIHKFIGEIFTPQRKPWPTGKTTTFTPNSGFTPFAKEKVVVIADEPPLPPPLGSLTETRGEAVVALDSGYVEDGKKFREVGWLDEAVMQRKDHEVVLEKASSLERDVFQSMQCTDHFS